MQNAFGNKKIKFHVYISSVVLITILIITAIHLWEITLKSTVAAHQISNRLFHEISTKTIDKVHYLMDSTASFAQIAADVRDMAGEPIRDGMSHGGLPMILHILENHPHIFQAYAGYDSGSFLCVTAIRNDSRVRKQHNAPESTCFIVRSVAPGTDMKWHHHFTFLDADYRTVGQRTEAPDGFDPRKRPWYLNATQRKETVFTEPYRFHYTKMIGLTCSRRIAAGKGVFGMDITLKRFSDFLNEQQVSEHGTLFLVSRGGLLIAASRKGADIGKTEEGEPLFGNARESSDPVIRAVTTAFAASGDGHWERTRVLSIGKEDYLVSAASFGRHGADQILAIAAPSTDFTAHISRMRLELFCLSILTLIVTFPLALWVSRIMTCSLIQLEKNTERIRRLEFSEPVPFRSRVKEMDSLIHAFSLMRVTIRQKTGMLIREQKKMEKLIELGIALSAEQDHQVLLKKILFGAKELSHSDAVTLYLKTGDNQLRFALRSMEDQLPADTIPLYLPETGEPNHQHVCTHVALIGETVNIPDVYSESRFDLSGTRRFDAETGYCTRSMLAIPLKPRNGEVVGVLQLMNSIDPESGEIRAYPPEEIGYLEALASQAAIALDNRNLLMASKELFNAFIRMIAGAIDAKSPYTGGHCSRMPEIAIMLAEAASDTQEVPFKDFKLSGEDEWQEFRVAAWLHDCGKVTIPENVVDKATKLETIHNRIHEIRTRFEVLWRDAEIEHLKKRLAGREEKSLLDAELETAREKIRTDFTFVAECNIGGEFMDDEKIRRLHRIAARKWIRNLDDTIGLSISEMARRKEESTAEPPVEECLLMDKKEHIIPWSGKEHDHRATYGIRMTVPENSYNFGELYNLTIRRGTLTPEERFKINDHIVQTIIMLSRLPFPKHLSRVPEYASAHHEALNGTGYPRKLTKADMSIPARIMAIADIFEALTASDRPYKPSKTVSESLRIMSLMRNDQKIDPDLFDLFLEKGIYETYAKRHLSDRQIDKVDIRHYMNRHGDVT